MNVITNVFLALLPSVLLQIIDNTVVFPVAATLFWNLRKPTPIIPIEIVNKT